MGRAYRHPRRTMAQHIDQGLSEPHALFNLAAACLLLFLASLPNAVREAASLDVDEPLTATIAAHIFGYFFVAPLLFYFAAAATHLVARAFGGEGSFLSARSALFWSALLGGPIAMLLSLVGVGAQVLGLPAQLPWLSYLGYAGLAFWLWLFAASLAEAEGFAATREVLAMLALVFAGVAVAVTMLAGGSGQPG